MIFRIMIMMLAAATLTSPINAGVWDNLTSVFKKPIKKEEPSIRVLVTMDQNSMHVAVNGPFKAYDPLTGETILLSKLGKNAPMQVMDGGLKWSEEFPGVHQMLIIPNSKETKICINGSEYPGTIYIYDVENRLSAVNKVNVETYLTSILSNIEDEDAPDELLSALAITARTNSCYLAEHPINSFWSIDGQTVGYHGNIDDSSARPINRAIHDTKHMVLSKTGAYEGVVTPFLAHWRKAFDAMSQKRMGVSSKITWTEAQNLANSGKNAAQLLNQAFPNTTIQLLHNAPVSR